MALTAKQVEALNALPQYVPALARDRTSQEELKLGDAIAEALVLGDLGIVDATVGAEGAVTANEIEVSLALTDVLGAAIAEARTVRVETLGVTADKGDIAEAATPVGTLVKAVNPATGPNVAYFQTTGGGLLDFAIQNDVAGDVALKIEADGCRPRLLVVTFA